MSEKNKYHYTNIDEEIETKLKLLLKLISWDSASNRQKLDAFASDLANSKVKTTNDSVSICFKGINAEDNLYRMLDVLVAGGIASPDIFSDKNAGENTKIIHGDDGLLYLKIDPYNFGRSYISNHLDVCIEYAQIENEKNATTKHQVTAEHKNWVNIIKNNPSSPKFSLH